MKKGEVTISIAVQCLGKALKDKPDFFLAWKNEIALSFQEEYNEQDSIKEISERAAEKFINILTTRSLTKL